MHSIERGKPHPFLYCAPSPSWGRGICTAPYIGHLKLACRFYLFFFIALTAQVHINKFTFGGSTSAEALAPSAEAKDSPQKLIYPLRRGRAREPQGWKEGRRHKRSGKQSATASQRAARPIQPAARRRVCRIAAAALSSIGRQRLKRQPLTLGRRGCRRAERWVEDAAQKKTNLWVFFKRKKNR